MIPIKTKIIKVVSETPNIRTLYFDKYLTYKPGQFIMVWIHGIDEIPMALSYENAITVQKVGDATSKLFSLKESDSIGIRGAFGNGFKIYKGNILIIAGGVGASPMAHLAEKAKNYGANVTTLLGASTKKELFFRERFEKAGDLKIATDDGSEGIHGYVTELLKDTLKYDQIYCCGPEPMMKKVLDSIDASKAQFSLNRYFKCGIGICGSCCIDGYRVCKDGPVFTGEILKNSEFGYYKRDESGKKIKL